MKNERLGGRVIRLREEEKGGKYEHYIGTKLYHIQLDVMRQVGEYSLRVGASM